MLMPTVRRFSDRGSRWTVTDPVALADEIRVHARHMARARGADAPDGLEAALSSAEQLAAVFATARPGRDRLVCSPAHHVLGPYAAAVAVGLLDRSALTQYGADGSPVDAVGSARSPVVDHTCGSPGEGLSAAAGYALADRIQGRDSRTFTLMSEAETEEGQVWEAARFAARHSLSNLTVVLDATTAGESPPAAARWTGFGWCAAEVDGHDLTAVREALETARRETDGPTAVICRGRGDDGTADDGTGEARPARGTGHGHA
ncbi:thiamine pyrophosphate-dependent enzyme [Streptomyces sp. NPDC004610]|uniref:thiamine pyrophosphate-dependent enzyme n=1 Tax=unclassified Streptomyces TaxID=2593676 RepID=UPI00339DE999